MKKSKAYRKLVSLLLVVAMLATTVPPNSSPVARAGSLGTAEADQTAVGMNPTSEWVNFYSQNSALNGQSLPVDTVVRAYNPRGVQCGEFTVEQAGWYGLMPVYRDNPATPQDEGMLPGEAVSFTVNDAPATPIGPDAPVWTTNGDIKQIDLVAEGGRISHHVYLPMILKGVATEGQVRPSLTATPGPPLAAANGTTVMISLQSGWNLISFNVLPPDDNITTVLAPIQSLYTVVLGFDGGGLSYYPHIPPSMNTLRTLDPYHGYWIRMNSAGTLSVIGDPVLYNTPLSMQSGWNLVSYLPNGSDPVSDALATIDGLYTVVLGFDGVGQSYYPELPPEMNSLQSLDLLHGYWVYMSSAGTITYPEPSQTPTPTHTSIPEEALPPSPTPLPTATPTPTPGPRLEVVYPPATIVADTTWSPADGVYVINSTVTVNPGVVLTIQPGVVIKFGLSQPDYYCNWTGMIVNGTLIAQGTSTDPIVFTSIQDDFFAGDTNNDRSATTADPGNWGNVYFSPSSTGGQLDHVIVRYGGRPCGSESPQNKPTLVYVSGVAPTLSNSRFEQSSGYGVMFANSAAPTVTNCVISNNQDAGVHISASSAPTLEQNVIANNGDEAIYTDGSSQPTLDGNTVYSNGTNGMKVSGPITVNMTWQPDLTYVIEGTLTVNSGIRLTIEPGVIVKFGSGGITVNGTLTAQGSVASSIVFTSLEDDAYGGDTNNDGTATRPAPGDWGSITFSSSSTSSVLDHTVVRYGGYSDSANIVINGSAPIVTNNWIGHSSNDGLQLSNVALPVINSNTIANNLGDGLEMATSSAPDVTNNGFLNNANYALRMDGSCGPAFSGNTASDNVYNGIGVSGSVPANITWVAGVPYIIDGSLTVNAGIQLTIQPGTVVKLRSGNLTVQGTLNASGTSGNKIVFTSIYDTAALSGGNTLGRMSLAAVESMLAPGDWGRIEFASTASGSVLSYVVVRYGSSSSSYGSLHLNGGSPSISNAIITDSRYHGIYATNGATPVINYTTVTASGDRGIYCTGSANPTIHNSNIYDNANYGLYNASSSVIVDATNNWWGDASGPTHSGNPGGSGDRVSDYVTYDPWQTTPGIPEPTPYPTPTPTPTVNNWSGYISSHTTWTPEGSPYVVNGDLTVGTGVILTIQPGVVVKFTSSRKLTVNGTLAANGTAEDGIVFTSFKDDAAGGDTNNDGGATSPAPGDWRYIEFTSSSTNSSLVNVTIKYAGYSYGSVYVNGTSPLISNSTIRFSNSYGIYAAGAAAPTITGNIIRDNQQNGIHLVGSFPTIADNVIVSNVGYAIYMDGTCRPDFSGNTAYYNGTNGIGVSGHVSSPTTWPLDLPYIIADNVTVDTGVILTIDPGTIVKFNSGRSLTINGALVAAGTTDDRVVFTSINDDSVGGDTNNNGSQTWPAPGDWSLIHFTASSLSSSSLTYANVTYGGVKVTGASPTIANDLIAYANGYGLHVESLGAPTIRDNVIRHNRDDGLRLESSSAPTVQNNQFISNWGYAVKMHAGCTPTFIGNVATDNRTNAVGVWGNASATTIWEANLTYVIEGVTIESGVVLTLEPGTVVKFASAGQYSDYKYIEANGALVAQSTSDKPIVFTSIKDDSAGGDTNNDGAASSPAPRDWKYIRFAESSSGSRLDWVQVRYGGYAYCSWGCTYYPSLFLDGSAVSMSNATVSDSHWDAVWIKNASPTWNNVTVSNSRAGIYLENAHLTISNSTIRDNSVYGIYGTNSAPTITSSTISNNAECGIYGNALNPTITSSTISNSRWGIYIENGQNGRPTISNSTISDNTEYGIYGYGLNPTITGSTISNSKRGLYLYNTSAPYPNISGNTFANNLEYAASIEIGALPTFGANTFVGTVGNGINVGGGTLTQNAMLYGAGVYVIGKIIVEQGVTLTIQPGAIIKAYGGSCYESCPGIVVKGALTAIGQEMSPIVFASTRDDAHGGDTNGDGAETAPTNEDWAGIHFGPTSSTSAIEHAIIKFAGKPIHDGSNYFYAAISVNNSSPTISNSTFENNGPYGLYLTGANPSINNNTISGSDYGIYAVSSSFPTITGNSIGSITGSWGYGVYLDDSSHATLSNNTFTSNPVAVSLKADALPYVGENTASSSTGNYINVRSGTIASNTTLYPGFVYVFDYTTVNAGTVLTLRSGTVIKIRNGGYLLMRGRLAAQGTADQKIVITAYYDDTYGGDTNNDGANTTPSLGDWRGIYLGTSDSNLDHIILKYGGMGGLEVDGTWYSAMLILNGVSPTVSNSTIARSSDKGIHVINANPNINNSDIWGNYYGIYTQNGARPTIHNNNIRDNQYYGVYNADTTLVVDAINNAWGHDSGPAPVGAGNGVNYSEVWDPNTQSYIRTYYVAFDPWNGKTHWIEHNLGVLKQWIAYVAEPVNTATGNYTYNYQDLRIPGRGLSLTFQRFYNTLSTYQGPLGYGWTFNYGMNVREEDSNALVMNGDGRVDKYVPDGSGGYTPPKGVYDTLTKSGGTFTLKRKDQTRFSFNSSGKLASIVDKNGNTITLGYTGGNLTSVTDPTGRALNLSYDGSNRITQITDPTGRTISFAYEELGGDSRLISVTDARGNTSRYAYDSKHRLLTITDPNNHIFVTNIYDADGRVVTQRDARLNNTAFSYDTNAKVTRVTDPRGNTTTYTYDAELRLQSERDPAGQTISHGYDSNNNRIRVTDRRGNITRYAYDAMGNTTVITDALGGVVTMTYDGLNNLTSQTDTLGRTTTYTYDARGNLIRTTDALDNSTTFAYDANGLMTSTTDARGNTMAFGYDSHGNQTSITDPLGNTAISTYDTVGRKLTETDALGRAASYTHDANNNLLTVTDAAGGVTTYTYDAVGNRLTVTDPLGRVTTYAHDEKDRLVSVTNPLGGVTRYEYDANDNKIHETDPLTHTMTFAYDSLNRLTQVTNPLNKTTRYGYDVDGNRTSVTDANGKTTNFTYDALSRLTRVTDPLLDTTSYVYDAVGNKIRVIDAEGNTTHYEYDALSRLVKVTDALSGEVRYAYDEVGNKTSMTDANSHTTTYAYDALNRLIRVTDPLGNPVQYGYDAVGNRTSLTNARSQITAFTYDNLNRLTGINYPDGSSVAYTYDAVGNRTQMVDSTGTTTYAYDALNRVTSITNPGSRVVSYSYDDAGNRIGVAYPDSKTVTYTYDDANRLTGVTDWAGQQTTYAYDNAGNLTGQTNPNNTTISLTYDAANRLTGLIHTSTVSGTVASFSYTLDKVGNRIRVVDTEGTTTYEYDKLYRLTNVTYPDATFAAYQYDPMGNRTVMTATLGVTTYTYDAADRLQNAGPITFTWDADGNMLSKGSMTFTYDAANRLTQVISGTTTVDFVYDGDGRRASKAVNGTPAEYIYDTIAGLAYVLTEQTGGNTTLYTYGTDLIAQTAPDGTQSYYHPDGLGSTRALTNGSGQVTARYSYDAFGAVRSSSGSPSTAFKFAGEQTDDEIGLIYLRARYYDPATGRFITKDPFAGADFAPGTLNRYVYANNNPINIIDPTGQDWLDALGVGLAIGGVALFVAGAFVSSPVIAAAGVLLGGAAVIVKAQQFARDTNSRDWSNSTPEQRRAWLEQDKYDLIMNGISFGLHLGGAGARLAGLDRVARNIDAFRSGVNLGDKLFRPSIRPKESKPLTFDDLPTGLCSASRLSERLGTGGFATWARSGGAQRPITVEEYRQHLALTPHGALLLAVESGPEAITPQVTGANYVTLSRLFRQAGFNPASPQPPPGGSK